MNFLDIIVIGILLISIYTGYKKGLIHQLATLIAIIVGIYIAIKFSKDIAPWISSTFTWQMDTSRIIGFAVLFITTLIIIMLIGHMLHKNIEDTELSSVNKIGGSIFSMLKATLMISMLIVALGFFNKQNSIIKAKDIEESFSYKPIASIAPAIFPYLKSLINKEEEKEKNHDKK